MYKNIYLYSVKEVLTKCNSDTPVEAYDQTIFYNVLHSVFPHAPIYKDNSLKDNLEELLTLFVARMGNEIALVSEKDSITVQDCTPWINKLINQIVITYEKYNPILQSFRASENDLLNPIVSSSDASVGENDTPQNEGEFGDDSHRSRVVKTHTEASIDGATKVERLSEIRSKFSSILLEWCNTFDNIIIEEENL